MYEKTPAAGIGYPVDSLGTEKRRQAEYNTAIVKQGCVDRPPGAQIALVDQINDRLMTHNKRVADHVYQLNDLIGRLIGPQPAPGPSEPKTAADGKLPQMIVLLDVADELSDRLGRAVTMLSGLA